MGQMDLEVFTNTEAYTQVLNAPTRSLLFAHSALSFKDKSVLEIMTFTPRVYNI